MITDERRNCNCERGDRETERTFWISLFSGMLRSEGQFRSPRRHRDTEGQDSHLEMTAVAGVKVAPYLRVTTERRTKHLA